MTATSALLRDQANRRLNAAAAEASEQLSKVWTVDEVLAVMVDAAGPIADLLDQADSVDELAAERAA